MQTPEEFEMPDSPELVICGRFEKHENDKLKPKVETRVLIETIMDELDRRELRHRVDVSVCNCGRAAETGLSIFLLPEKVRYFDCGPQTVAKVIDRHLEPMTGQPL